MPHLPFGAGLGKQEAYSSAGYSLSIVWQPDYNIYWNSLGCLDSLVSLKINGTMPNLPAAWAENSSFPLLQVKCLLALVLNACEDLLSNTASHVLHGMNRLCVR